MGKNKLTHEINCNQETFWKVFLDKDFATKLYKKVLGCPEFAIIGQHETDTQIIRKLSVRPKINLPAPVMKLYGNNYSYIEEGVLNKATKIWTWKQTPSVMQDKLRNEGTMRIEPIDDTRVWRIIETVIEAKVFGVGPLIESSSEKSLREECDASAAFFSTYLSSMAG